MVPSTKIQVLTDLSPFIKVYTERLLGTPHVPPSLEDPTTGVSSKDTTISPNVSARLYLPKLSDPTQKLPILVYYHGGGFCVESAFSFQYHRYMNILSAKSGALVVSVEYRLAPEHLLPAAYDDSWYALKWAGSESLPGNVKILGAILSYPHFAGSNPTGDEDIASRLWLFAYPSAPSGVDNPSINPLADGAPSLSTLGFSKIIVNMAGNDDFTPRGLAYADGVKNSGWKGELEVVVDEGEGHCYHIIDPETDKAKNLIKHLGSFISQ
ncbi:UNVERIFIED_CONTAM: 2-hydroxyisoflavanone dehydratase [Sesamum latifolium]|uniref:2-hydroxyisoflavanone dehydratase n=1 Tax=Sesamum latifolium TaxID=2727402 RepID=A0AAW2VZ73_9LAMI